MHEFMIARNLAQLAEAEARTAGGQRVIRVFVRIGVMRMLDSWLMQEAWVLACEGTLCEECELVIESSCPLATCPACGARYAVKGDGDCPRCGNVEGALEGGDELELVRIEIENTGRSAAEKDAPALQVN